MNEIQLQIDSGRQHEFTVIERDGCVLVRGALSVDGMRGVAAMCSKKAIISPELARMLGANFAFGLQADVDALIAKIKPEQIAAAKRSAGARGLSEAAAVWLASGERGSSSNAIFTKLTGINACDLGGKKDHPYDPADVRRCWLLLEDVPELKAGFHKMAHVSDQWDRLVASWDSIIAALTQEWGDIRKPKRGAAAEQTYKLIKHAIGR